MAASKEAKELAEAVLALDNTARAQGLYVGAGRDKSLPDTCAAQEGPMWKALKAQARAVLSGEDKCQKKAKNKRTLEV